MRIDDMNKIPFLYQFKQRVLCTCESNDLNEISSNQKNDIFVWNMARTATNTWTSAHLVWKGRNGAKTSHSVPGKYDKRVGH